MAVPIWKDYYVDFGNVTSVDYEIRLTDGSIIFSGRSYRRPDDVSLKVKINDICADYLKSSNGSGFVTEYGFESNDAAKEFRVFLASGTLVDTVVFINDWSYDMKRFDTGVLSDPINGNFDMRMPLKYSVSRDQTINVELVGTGSWWDEEAGSAGTLTLEDFSIEDVDVKIGDFLYRGKTTCHTHALYYVNAYGGWDFLLLEGRTVETDSYTRHEHKTEYNNTSADDRGTINYLNEVEKSFVLHTGWMKNEEAAKMHHLLGSTNVYLYDITNSVAIPVVITDNACKYKTFQNEGGKLVEYEINVKVAKEMIRR